MRLSKVMVLVSAFCIVGALIPTKASAEFRLRVEDPSTGQGVVITDNGTGDWSSLPGMIVLGVSDLGSTAWSFTLAQSHDHPFDGTALGDLYLSSLTVTSSGPGQLLLTIEDTGFSGGPGQLLLTSSVLSGSLSGDAGSSVHITSYADPSNSVPNFGADSPTVGPLGAMGALGGVGTAEQVVSSSSLNPLDSSVTFNANAGGYALYTQVLINLTGAAELHFDQEARVTATGAQVDGSPEPASLMLISTGLLGLAGGRRRFKFNRG